MLVYLNILFKYLHVVFPYFVFISWLVLQRKQHTVTRDKKETELIARGRHDPCVVPRAVPMVEAMVALVLMDQLMAQYSQSYLFPINSDLQEPLAIPRLEAAKASV